MQNQTANTLKSKALSALETGKPHQALKKAQLGLKKFPKDSDFHAIAGFVLTEMKQYRKSIPHFVEAARMKPQDPQFVENLANALMQTGQIPKALDYAEQKLEIFPNNKELNRVLDEIYLKGNNWRQIIDHTTKKLAADPDNVDLLSTRARAYGRVGFDEDSSNDINHAYRIAPESHKVALLKAVNLHQGGDKAGTKAILERILNENPDHINSLLQLSTMVGGAEAGSLLKNVESAIERSEHKLSELEFAKAHLTHKIDGLDAAMPQFEKANAVQHDSNPYNFESEEEKLGTVTRQFSEGNQILANDVSEGPLPIFVVGQPRSGTTLMEMMLSSDPNIAGCGELMLGSDLSVNFWQGKDTFDTASAAQFAQEFRKLMPPIPEGSIAFVDKMPHNFQRVGYLLSAFPNARVINMQRDPRDVGLSKWIRRFPAGGMRYASNQKAIAHTANLYRRYMAHWEKVFGDRILTVPYEKLVADPETYSKKVAAFCGIEWSDAMMHPEENKKQVRTASIDQVRNKISTKSVGGWRSVRHHLQPMLDGIDPALWPEYEFD
ncbi:tetratricopeptide repeat-containing sulfotransferase family protein [Ruegeria lacuscaerulensis]|uniref:tetratricopeptide repeat-containing sulfotransferase family protein n=1 Tax=Ruegeria lacuscaerulensis TaxID=55218 RepID=UPI00147E5C35|nr:tetratricopeptide repeat-containing sulfotransferase family protein [Ruegeria lacuscaerulensis]